MEFKYPTRQDKKKSLTLSEREQILVFFKGQEYSEAQALFLYLYKLNYGIDVYLPVSFIEDVENKNKNLNLSRPSFQVIWICNGKGDGELHFPEEIIEFIKRDSPKRGKVVSLHLWTCPRINGGHANVLYYDTKEKTVERFEPNGLCSVKNEWYDSPALDGQLRSYFEEHDIKYLSPQSPYYGWQRVQINQQDEKLNINTKEDYDNIIDKLSSLEKEEYILNQGFCVVWCMQFIQLKCQNPNTSSKILIEEFLSKLKKKDVTCIEFIKLFTIELMKKTADLFI